MAEAGSWPQAPKDAVIIGLKELPESSVPLIHTHVMFGHCYKVFPLFLFFTCLSDIFSLMSKGQDGSKAFLTRFKQGGGKLYDLEFLVDETGRRVAAFGRAAGTVGMALGLLVWSYKQIYPGKEKPCPPQFDTFQTYEELVTYVKATLDKAVEKAGIHSQSLINHSW